MFRKALMAAIAAIRSIVIKWVTKVIEVGGKAVLMVVQLVEHLATPPGAGGGSEEGEAVRQAHEQAQESQEAAERVMTAGDYATNLRFLARRRAEGRAIDPTIWERLPEPLADYVRGLSLPECDTVAKQPMGVLVLFLEGREDRIPGVRTPDEVIKSSAMVPKRPVLEGTAEGVENFRAQLAASLAKARPAPEASGNVVPMRAA